MTRSAAGDVPRARWSLLWAVVGGLVVVGAAFAAFVVRFDRPARHTSGDTWFYSWQAATFAGAPDAEARLQASELVCTDLHGGLHLDGSVTGVCGNYRATRNPRYVAIFTSRPLWPLLMAPGVAMLGLPRGMLWGSLLGALLAALAVFLALRRLGCSPVAATAAGVAFSLLPTGFESDKILPEGAVLAVLVAGVHGAGRLVRGSWWGLAWLVPVSAALYALKPANGAAFAVALLAAGLVLLPLPGGGRPQALALAGVGLAAVAGWFWISNALGLPSLTETAQDLATHHFTHPDVPHPLGVLRSANDRLWGQDVERFLGLPYPFAIVLPAVVIAVIGLRRAGVVWALVSLSAIGIVVAHPMLSQYDRLVVSVWLVVVAAVAVLVDAARAGTRRLVRRSGRPVSPDAAPSVPVASR